jgi:hypothetical protein
LDWNPCLILFNNDLRYWVNTDQNYYYHGYIPIAIDQEMSNVLFFQGRGGVKPTPQWDVNLAISYAQADKNPADYSNGTYGTKIDLTGTYKITNNLSYMVGFGYLFTGNYFKGPCSGGPRIFPPGFF